MRREFMHELTKRSPMLCLTILLMVMGSLMALPANIANAFPVVCSDIDQASDRVLTGCRNGVDESQTEVTAADPAGNLDENPSPVDAVLRSRPTNKQLFQVGRHGLEKNIQGQNDRALSSGQSTDSNKRVDEGNANFTDRMRDAVTYDERWYYMSIDKDGTYLFVGDAVETEGSASNTDEDTQLPDGIGIGKKWYF